MQDKRKSLVGWKTKQQLLWPFIFMAPFVLCFFMFNIYPTLYTFHISFFNWDGINNKIFVGLQNYQRIIGEDVNFRRSLLGTLRIFICSYPLAIFGGMVIAAFISSIRKGKHVVQTITFLPYITTPVAIGLIFSLLFDWSTGVINRVLMAIGIIDQHLNWLGDPGLAFLVVAFMIIWKTTGYYMTIYAAGISSISDEYYEAAKIDGASVWTCFWKITVPLLKPITIFVTITAMISGLQLFDEPSLLFSGAATGVKIAGGPMRSCLTIVWNFHEVAFRTTNRLGYGSAIAIVLFVIIALLASIGVRFMKGLDQQE